MPRGRRSSLPVFCCISSETWAILGPWVPFSWEWADGTLHEAAAVIEEPLSGMLDLQPPLMPDPCLPCNGDRKSVV